MIISVSGSGLLVFFKQENVLPNPAICSPDYKTSKDCGKELGAGGGNSVGCNPLGSPQGAFGLRDTQVQKHLLHSLALASSLLLRSLTLRTLVLNSIDIYPAIYIHICNHFRVTISTLAPRGQPLNAVLVGS